MSFLKTLGSHTSDELPTGHYENKREMLWIMERQKKAWTSGNPSVKMISLWSIFRFFLGSQGYSTIKRVTASICHSYQPPSANLTTLLCAMNAKQASGLGTRLLLFHSVHWEHQVPSPSELLCSLCLLPKHRERDTQPKVSNWKEHLQNYLRRFHVISRNWQIEHQSNQNRVSLGKTEIHVSQPHSLNDGL